jgi:hypothetical protein
MNLPGRCKKAFFLTIVLSSVVIADTVDTVDQSQTTRLDALLSAESFAPLGQSFVPSFNTLNFIELRMVDSGGFGYGSSIYLNVREDSIDGPIIATSETLFLEDCFNFEEGPGCGKGGGPSALVRFNFPLDVPVIAGETFVFEVVKLPGGDGVNVGRSYSDQYPNGGYYNRGVFSSADLWFIEGFSEEVVWDYTQIHSISDGNILDDDGNGGFDTVDPAPGTLGIRTFSTLREVSVSHFDIDATNGMAAAQALLQIEIVGISNGTEQVDVYGFNDNLSTELEDATAPGLLLGSYNPAGEGLGGHTIVLDTDNLNELIWYGGALTLRFSSEEDAANTQINSLYLGGAQVLELDLEPALPPGC